MFRHSPNVPTVSPKGSVTGGFNLHFAQKGRTYAVHMGFSTPNNRQAITKVTTMLKPCAARN